MKLLSTIFISALLFGQTVFAGPNVVGNGGNGVFIDNNFYLLDLVESDSHQTPFIRDTSSTYFYTRLKYAMSEFQDLALVTLTARKMTEFGSLDLHYTEALLRAFEAVRWNIVDYPLTLIPVATPVAAELHQIAIRTNDNILINRHFWNLLTPEHRMALLFHEANFILIRPGSPNNPDDYQKSAFQSRLLTGYTFSDSMANEYRNSFARRLTPLFPSTLSYVNGEMIYSIYKTKAYSAFAAEEVITVNPYLEIKFSSALTKLSLNLLSVEDLITAICHQKELPSAVILKTHILRLELYKGDNNTQDYLAYFPALDEGFPPFTPSKNNCVAQATKLFADLSRHTD